MLRLTTAFFLITAVSVWLSWRRLNISAPFLKITTLAMLCLLFFRPLVSEATLTFLHIYFENAVLLTAFLIIMYKLGRDKEPIIYTNFDKSFFVFLTFLAAGILYSVNKQASIEALIYFLSLFLWSWTIVNLHSDTSEIRKLLLNTLIFAAVAVLLYGLYQYFIGFNQMRLFANENPQTIINSREFLRRLNANTIFSTFLYPPALAGYLGMLFLIILGRFAALKTNLKSASQDKFKCAIYIFVLFAFIFAIMLTKSKGAWVSTSISLLLFGFLGLKREKAVFLFLLILITAFAFFKIISFSRTMDMPNLASFQASFSVRGEYSKATWGMIKSRPLFGFGPGTYASVYPYFKTKTGEETKMAHNSFLQIWAECGLFAFLSFISILFAIFKTGNTLVKNKADPQRLVNIGLYCALVCFFIHNLVDFSLYINQNAMVAFTILAALFLANQPEGSRIRKEFILGNLSRRVAAVLVSFLISAIFLYNCATVISHHLSFKARTDFLAGNLGRANQKLEKAVLFNPFNAHYRFLQAVVAEKQTLTGNPDHKPLNSQKAISRYKQAIRLDPFVPYYHFRLGVFLLQQKSNDYYKMGLEEIKKASQLYPANPYYHEQLAMLYDIMGKDIPAKNEWKLAEELKKFYIKGTR
ncbi:MAG: O-antigen ligase family protein [Candidatus Omnitrophota bacterium]